MYQPRKPFVRYGPNARPPSTPAGPSARANGAGGLSGALGGIHSYGHLLSLLRAHFQPVSTVAPPASRGGSGGRIVSIATASKPAPTAADSARLALVAGVVRWDFTTKFSEPPHVTVTAIGVPPSAGTTVYVTTRTSTAAAQIQSTDSSDVREVYVTASGFPG